MQTVGQQLGYSQPAVFNPSPALVTNDRVGVEIELEGFTDRAIRDASRMLGDDWLIERDGSLRNGGVEFITNGGLGGTRLAEAFSGMHTMLEEVPYSISFRCSTHMHIDMLDFTVPQLVKFILLYTATEPWFFNFCGTYRHSSNFCTPLNESIPFHKKILSLMAPNAIVSGAPARYCNKYTALNLAPLFRTGDRRPLGTVEFRGSYALTSNEKLLQLANLLLSLKKYAREYQGTEEEMLSSVMSSGVVGHVIPQEVIGTLQCNGEQQENAMINAWLLLKAYQQGLNRAVSQEVEHTEGFVGTRPFQAQYFMAPRMNRPLSDGLDQAPTEDSIQWGQSIFDNYPAVLRALGSIQNGVPSVSIRAIEESFSNHFPRTNVKNELIGFLSGYTTADKVRFLNSRNSVQLAENICNNLRNRRPSVLPIVAPQDTRRFETRRAMWMMFAEDRVVLPILRELFGTESGLHVLTQSNVWRQVRDSNVRIKRREVLNQALERRGVTYQVKQREPISFIRKLMYFADVRYEDHVWRGDIEKYRRVRDAVDVLTMLGFQSPMWNIKEGNILVNEWRSFVSIQPIAEPTEERTESAIRFLDNLPTYRNLLAEEVGLIASERKDY